ncbi:MAG TPA: sterol desaturase family protein [Kiloniellales bacterium]
MNSQFVETILRYFTVAFEHFVLNPYFYAFLGVIFLLERFWPVDARQPFFSKGMIQDFTWYLVNGTASFAVIPLYLGLLQSVYDAHLSFLTVQGVANLPQPLLILFAVLCGDCLAYFQHYLRHRVAFFWPFHAVHHSQVELNIFTNHRFHIVDRFVAKTIVFLPLMAFQLNVVDILALEIVKKWYTRLYHANVRSNFGILRYVLVTPQSHRIHHSRDPRHHERNYGFLFSIWDHLFGTQYRNYDEYPPCGIDDERFPVETRVRGLATLKNLVVQTLYPFRALFNREARDGRNRSLQSLQ